MHKLIKMDNIIFEADTRPEIVSFRGKVGTTIFQGANPTVTLYRIPTAKSIGNCIVENVPIFV